MKAKTPAPYLAMELEDMDAMDARKRNKLLKEIQEIEEKPTFSQEDLTKAQEKVEALALAEARAARTKGVLPENVRDTMTICRGVGYRNKFFYNIVCSDDATARQLALRITNDKVATGVNVYQEEDSPYPNKAPFFTLPSSSLPMFYKTYGIQIKPKTLGEFTEEILKSSPELK